MTTLPAWADIALAEEGIVERPGPDQHHPRILDYHETTTLKATTDEISWCSSFVNWVMEQAGFEGTDSAAARSWLEWGQECPGPAPWAIVVFWRGSPKSWKGHVGFVVDVLRSGDLRVWGGNQSDQVCARVYDDARLLGYRYPNGVELPPPLTFKPAVAVDKAARVRDVQRSLRPVCPDIMVDGIPGPQTRGCLSKIGL